MEACELAWPAAPPFFSFSDLNAAQVKGASPTWSPLSSFNDDRIEMRKTDCFGNTRLVPHVLESVISDLNAAQVKGASPTWSPLSSFNDDRIEMRKTALETQDLSRTYLAHHGLESVIIIIINAVQHQHAECCVTGNPLSSEFLHMAHAPYLRTAAVLNLSARRLQLTQWI